MAASSKSTTATETPEGLAKFGAAGKVINGIFAFVESYGMALALFGIVIFFLWLLWAVDFSTV